MNGSKMAIIDATNIDESILIIMWNNYMAEEAKI